MPVLSLPRALHLGIMLGMLFYYYGKERHVPEVLDVYHLVTYDDLMSRLFSYFKYGEYGTRDSLGYLPESTFLVNSSFQMHVCLLKSLCFLIKSPL